MIPVLRPSYTALELAAVHQVLQSGWSGLGPKVAEFEQAFAARLGVKHAIATNSCTAALHLAMKLVGVSRGSRVIVPTLTFVSTAHAAVYLSATPVFCDIDYHSLMADPASIARIAHQHSGRIDAIVYVNYSGQLPEGDIQRLFPRFPVIYDCAHAMGSEFDARGKICCWSFHAVKNLSTGEGGMLTTDDDHLAERARRLSWMGISTSTYARNYETSTRPGYKWEYDVSEVGFKSNFNDIQAAIGLVQLQRLDEMQQKRQNLVARYLHRLPVDARVFNSNVGSSHHLFVIRCQERDSLHNYLREHGVSTGVHYKPIHLYPCYGHQDSLPVAERTWKELLSLPMFPDLGMDTVDHICALITDFYSGSHHWQEGT